MKEEDVVQSVVTRCARRTRGKTPRARLIEKKTMVLAADRGRAVMKLYHGSSFALAALVPAAAVAPGGQLPIDLALGAALPVHSHIALNFVRRRV